MNWSSIGSFISTVAPALGALIGGPVGVAAGAVAAVSNALLGKPDASPQEIEQALKSDPEAFVKLRQAEMAYSVKMEELGLKPLELANADRSSARTMRISTGSLTTDVLAFVLTLGFFGLLGLMSFYEMPITNKDALLLMLGSLAGAWTTMIAFFYGDSNASRRPK